jgi:hypothetical protein
LTIAVKFFEDGESIAALSRARRVLPPITEPWPDTYRGAASLQQLA